MFKRVLPIIIVILFATTVISCVMIADTMIRSNAENKDFENLAALIQTQSEKHTDEKHNIDSKPTETKLESIFTRNLNPLYKKNSDCIGWICIPNTKVDYPVMHTPQDPQKYLRKNFDCEYSSSGVPFLQENNTLDSDNLIIYGHNMKNGTMFSDITKYRNESYCIEHPTIELETKRGLKLYTVFAVVQLKNVDDWYQFAVFVDEADFQNKVTEIKAAALYTTGIEPQYGQQLLTLSTCYGSRKSDRLIVIATEI